MGEGDIKLSIVIPTYNRAEILKGTLRSVVQQKIWREDIEIIISNDASPDHTQSVLENFKAENPSKKIKIFHHEKNLKGPGNWKFCLENARGEFVFLLSDDDEISENFLFEYFRVIDENPDVDIVYSGFEYRDNNMQFLSENLLSSQPGLLSGGERLKNQLLANHMVMSAMYRRSKLVEAGGWSADYGVHLDGAAFSMTALRSGKTYFIDKPLFFYRVGADSWSKFAVEKKRKEYLWYRRIVDRLIDDAQSYCPELVPFLKEQYSHRAQNLLNILEVKYSNKTVSRKEIRTLVVEILKAYPEAIGRLSVYKVFMIGLFGNSWLQVLRKVLSKPGPQQSEAQVFDKSA